MTSTVKIPEMKVFVLSIEGFLFLKEAKPGIRKVKVWCAIQCSKFVKLLEK